MIVITNPRLIVWPDKVTELARVDESGRVVKIGLISIELHKLLRAWSEPIAIDKVIEDLQSIQSSLTSHVLLELNIIIISGQEVLLSEWDGFRVSDTVSMMLNKGVNEIEIEEWDGVDFPVYILNHSVNDGCFRSLISWFSSQTFSLSDIDSESTSFSKHWVRLLDCNVESLLMVPVLGWIDAVCKITMSMFNLQLIEVKGYVTPYGDVPTYHKDSEIGPTITCILYCHPKWNKDWSGELIIANSDGEPRIAVLPEPGRMVMFRGDLLHKAGTPSRIAEIARQALVFRYVIL